MLGRIKNRLLAPYRRMRKRRKPLSRAPAVDDKTFVFIGGLHRSGTSILHRLLCEHPDTSGFEDTGVPEDEGQHLQSVFEPAYIHGGPGEFAFHAEAHLTEESGLISAASRDRLLREWGAYYDLERPVLLEKSPPNLIRSRFLRQMIPGSKFVFIVRHPIAVALATEKWSDNSIADLIVHWHRAYSIMLRDIDDADDCLVMRYEDLVKDPANCIERVCRLAGLPIFEPDESVVDHNQKYFLEWRRRYPGGLQEQSWDPSLVTGLMEHFAYSLDEPYVSAASAESRALDQS